MQLHCSIQSNVFHEFRLMCNSGPGCIHKEPKQLCTICQLSLPSMKTSIKIGQLEFWHAWLLSAYSKLFSFKLKCAFEFAVEKNSESKDHLIEWEAKIPIAMCTEHCWRIKSVDLTNFRLRTKTVPSYTVLKTWPSWLVFHLDSYHQNDFWKNFISSKDGPIKRTETRQGGENSRTSRTTEW